MREFGVNSFRCEIIDIGTSKDDLELKEKYWIQSLCTLTPHGYNLNSGGSTKQKVTVDGIVFGSKWKADQHIARTRAISLEAAKWRRINNKIDTKSPSKPGEGICKSKLYKAWSQIKHVAANPRSKAYTGFTMCEDWEKFEIFAQSVGEPPDDDYALVRVDKNTGYEPGNCIWMPKSDASKLASQHQKLMILIDDNLEETKYSK